MKWMLACATIGAAGLLHSAEPVGEWRFDEGRGAVVGDATGHARHGRVLNDGRGVKWVESRRGKAIAFEGGDPSKRNQGGCVAIDGFEPAGWTRAMTVAAWVKFTKIEPEATYEIVSNAVSDRGKGFRLRLSWGSLQFMSGEGGDGQAWAASTDVKEVEFKPGQWYHVAGTYDGSKFRVYVDGEMRGESEAEMALTEGLKVVYVGAYNGGYAYGLNGVVDDLRLYDYVRSDAQLMGDARLSE